MYLGYTGNLVFKNDRYLFKILLVAGKKVITRKWCQSEPPTSTEWIQTVNSIHEIEILTQIKDTRRTMSRQMGKMDNIHIHDTKLKPI